MLDSWTKPHFHLRRKDFLFKHKRVGRWSLVHSKSWSSFQSCVFGACWCGYELPPLPRQLLCVIEANDDNNIIKLCVRCSWWCWVRGVLCFEMLEKSSSKMCNYNNCFLWTCECLLVVGFTSLPAWCFEKLMIRSSSQLLRGKTPTCFSCVRKNVSLRIQRQSVLVVMTWVVVKPGRNKCNKRRSI